MAVINLIRVLVGAVQPFIHGQGKPPPSRRRLCKVALEMTNEHLPVLLLLQVHLIMKYVAAELCNMKCLGSIPTNSQSTSLTMTIGSFSFLMFHCSKVTVRLAVIPYKCKNIFHEAST